MEITNEQVESLANFVRDVMEDWPEMGALEGYDLQDIAERHKILIPQTVYAPCTEDGCWCSEYHGSEEMQKGVTCYRIADWLVRDAQLRIGADGAVAEESPKNLRTEDGDAEAMGEAG